MKVLYIKPYEVEELSIVFKGAHVYLENNKALFIGRNGCILITDIGLYEKISKRQLDDDIGLKLLQRGFADCMVRNAAEGCQQIESADIDPVFFMIDMTNRCNMKCKYCLRNTGDDSNSISDKVLIDICKYIADYCDCENKYKITVQPWGGEPLLEAEKIFMMQQEFEKRKLYPCISIETNGLLLTDELIDKLYEKRIMVSVSIDGYEKIHDMQRTRLSGRPSHSTVENSLKRLHEKYGDNIGIITTLTSNSSNKVEEIINYLVKDLQLKKIKLNFVHRSTFTDNNYLCMSPEQISETTLRIMNTIVELVKNGYQVYEYNIWTKLLNILLNRKGDVCISNGCHGGRKMITFDMNGNIFPCDVTDYPEEKMGSIYDGRSLNEVIKSAMQINKYFKSNETEECGSCPWQCYCKGGCTVHVKCAGFEPPCIDDIECSINTVLYPELVRLILTEPEVINALVGFDILN